MNDILTALYNACTGEGEATEGPNLSDCYQRTQEAGQARKALVEAVGDAVDVDGYGEAMECQGFLNGFLFAVSLCREVGRYG